MKSIHVRMLPLTALAMLLVLLFISCETTQDVQVYWTNEFGDTMDSKTFKATNDVLFLDNIKYELDRTAVEPERYHDVFLLSKVYLEAFPAGKPAGFVKELMVMCGLFSTLYDSSIQQKQYEFQKTYIKLGYIKDLVQQISIVDMSMYPYIGVLGKVLEKGYWDDEALSDFALLLQNMVSIDVVNQVVKFNVTSSQVQNRLKVFKENHRKWYEDTSSKALFSILGVPNA
ncbi:hypothetical protein [Sphaerochaeta sp.]|uniref:hypothetical protein n=1 Tax=Sphaerochaeta sp. TaxID=1972642 RepID=UPI0025830937|nr:hypothetical protein [Sphaerochaeta sp.]MDD3456848.1 hypothetical protein [Sphaerochaeta sp.]